MNKIIIYNNKRKKYYSGNDNFNFDLDYEVKTEQEFLNQKALLDSIYNTPLYMPTEGEIYTLTFIGTNKESLMFDGGFKDYVRVDNKPSELKYFKSLDTGDEVDLLIRKVDNKNFIIEGSIAQLYESRAHDTINSLREEESIVAFIKELTPAGYNVELHHDTIILQGFMPNTLAGINKLYSPESIVGKNFEVMVESYSKEEGTYIVSRRKYLKTLIPVAIEQLRTDTIYKGNVTGTTPFGIFVEFN